MVLHGDREPESVGMNLSICWRSSDFLTELLLTMVPVIVCQRSSLELASWSQKAGSSPQNLLMAYFIHMTLVIDMKS